MPLVSVILPVYNAEKYISRCIRSILSQSMPDFELLIINDASTDNSTSLIHQFEDHRISYHLKKHSGLSATRNYGLQLAKGKFIYFVDADDWIEYNLLEKCIETCELEQLNFLIFGYHLDRYQNGKYIHTREVVPADITWKRNANQLFIDGNHVDLLGYAWNKLYRKSFLDSFLPIFVEGTTLIEDILFNTEIYKNANRIRFIPESYYHYSSVEEETLSKKFYPRSFGLIKQRRNAIAEWIKNWDIRLDHEMAAYSLISGVRYCVFNLFKCANLLSSEQKKAYIKTMVEDSLVQHDVKYFIPDSEELFAYKNWIISKDYEKIYHHAKNIFGYSFIGKNKYSSK